MPEPITSDWKSRALYEWQISSDKMDTKFQSWFSVQILIMEW